MLAPHSNAVVLCETMQDECMPAARPPASMGPGKNLRTRYALTCPGHLVVLACLSWPHIAACRHTIKALDVSAGTQHNEHASDKDSPATECSKDPC